MEHPSKYSVWAPAAKETAGAAIASFSSITIFVLSMRRPFSVLRLEREHIIGQSMGYTKLLI